jgi:glycosyltransferase involved in cell wall biosynthesis
VRIAQVSPLYESVPPRLYGGTERVVSYLTEELVRMGHDVTLFASGDSRTGARLIATCPRALRLARVHDPHVQHILQLESAVSRQDEFDIIHFHTDYFHFPLSRHALHTPQVTTLHGRLDIPDLFPLYREFRDMPVVSISDAQRKPLRFANWQATVYHGLPVHRFALRQRPRESEPYLVFVGRISPEKRVDDAIRIARTVGLELRIAAKVDAADEEYFNEVIRPLLREPGICFLGEQDEARKCELMAGALVFLFPIDWPEPFGLVMIESMACGTPVVARRRGSAPEVIDEGRTGVLFEDLRDAPRAVERAASLSRADCRRWFEVRFSAGRMAEDYLRVYQRLADSHAPAAPWSPRRLNGEAPLGTADGRRARG